MKVYGEFWVYEGIWSICGYMARYPSSPSASSLLSHSLLPSSSPSPTFSPPFNLFPLWVMKCLRTEDCQTACSLFSDCSIPDKRRTPLEKQTVLSKTPKRHWKNQLLDRQAPKSIGETSLVYKHNEIYRTNPNRDPVRIKRAPRTCRTGRWVLLCEKLSTGGRREGWKGERVRFCLIYSIYLHIPSYTFIYLYIPLFTFIYLQIPPFTVIYLHVRQNIAY